MLGEVAAGPRGGGRDADESGMRQVVMAMARRRERVALNGGRGKLPRHRSGLAAIACCHTLLSLPSLSFSLPSSSLPPPPLSLALTAALLPPLGVKMPYLSAHCEIRRKLSVKLLGPAACALYALVLTRRGYVRARARVSWMNCAHRVSENY